MRVENLFRFITSILISGVVSFVTCVFFVCVITGFGCTDFYNFTFQLSISLPEALIVGISHGVLTAALIQIYKPKTILSFCRLTAVVTAIVFAGILIYDSQLPGIQMNWQAASVAFIWWQFFGVVVGILNKILLNLFKFHGKLA